MIEESGAAYPPTTNTNTRLEIALITPAKIVVLANSIVLLSAIYTTLYKLISILKAPHRHIKNIIIAHPIFFVSYKIWIY